MTAGCAGDPVVTAVEPSPPAAGQQAAEPAPVVDPAEAEDWWGWNAESIDEPPLLPDLPWHDNTGVWRAEDRELLQRHEGDFRTTSDGQVIDRVDITGKLLVVHRNVTVKRSWVHGRVVNSTPSAVRIIHCDLGSGEAGDYTGNAVKGLAQIYRANIFGVSDGVQTTPSLGAFVLQDSFLHDFRYASDPRTPKGNVHNDGFKADSKLEHTVLIKHNTFWAWTINNITEQETATRSSGPNWTDDGGPLESTGNTARDGRPENGLQNSGVMVAGEAAVKVYIDGNLFRGHAYSYINAQGGYVEVTNNRFASDEHVRGRKLLGGEVDVWSGNTDFRTGAELTAGP
ncbi:MAG: hypothetical protein ACLGIA_00385 [Actinomycetes bacterium]